MTQPDEHGPVNRSKLPDQYLFDHDSGAVTILGSRSDELGTLYWPPRLRCPRTGGTVSPASIPTTGTIWSWTFVFMPFNGDSSPSGDESGYGVALIDLDDGPRIAGVLAGDREGYQIGARVEAREWPQRTVDDQPVSVLAFERSDA